MGTKRLSDSINIGCADITFIPDGSSMPVYLGLTQGGAKLTYEPEFHEITADQTGKAPLDDVLIGEKVSLEANVLDTSLEKIALVCPTGKKSKDGKAVTFGQRVGLRATQHAGKLIVHPISVPLDDLSKDIIIYRTANTGGLELAYELEKEWVIPTKWKGYFEDFRKDGDNLFRIGEDIPDPEDNRRVVKFWITPSNPESTVGNTVDFKANAMFEDGSTEDVTAKCVWTSSETSKVTLAGTNPKTATAVATGSSIVRAEFIGYANSTVMVVK